MCVCVCNFLKGNSEAKRWRAHFLQCLWVVSVHASCSRNLQPNMHACAKQFAAKQSYAYTRKMRVNICCMICPFKITLKTTLDCVLLAQVSHNSLSSENYAKSARTQQQSRNSTLVHTHATHVTCNTCTNPTRLSWPSRKHSRSRYTLACSRHMEMGCVCVIKATCVCECLCFTVKIFSTHMSTHMTTIHIRAGTQYIYEQVYM